jgi:hypothetical protein
MCEAIDWNTCVEIQGEGLRDSGDSAVTDHAGDDLKPRPAPSTECALVIQISVFLEVLTSCIRRSELV